MTIQVEIVTPSRQLYSGEVEMITMPGVEGEMGVLAGHAPLLTTLNIGELTLHNADGEPEYIAVSGGVVEVLPDKVIVMARRSQLRLKVARRRRRTRPGVFVEDEG
ncbi:MAG: ATP synthase F1 subunit epsilon [Caldilineaceae bacterium]|nr:ATP synthase F1 subunit epsilon [Caldilineaceae bacterium]